MIQMSNYLIPAVYVTVDSFSKGIILLSLTITKLHHRFPIEKHCCIDALPTSEENVLSHNVDFWNFPPLSFCKQMNFPAPGSTIENMNLLIPEGCTRQQVKAVLRECPAR